MADFRVRVEGTLFSSRLPEQLRAQTKKAAYQMANDAVAIMRIRTQAGQSADGNAFAPYSPAYARYRAKKGRGTNPDLTFTGEMLRAMDVLEVADTGDKVRATIGFTSALANNKAAYNSDLRPFLGLTPADEQRLSDLFNEYVNFDEINK